jgi:hypothetical protein
MDGVYQSAKRGFEQLDELCIHRATSQEAGLSFEDGCVDWVYIADSYYYEVVAVDLEIWHKKLTTPGVLFGRRLSLAKSRVGVFGETGSR